jgi:hypothetical protein
MSKEHPQNLVGMKFLDVASVQIAEFHDLPDGQGGPTQVHMLLHLKGSDVPIILRFKGPDSLNEVVEALRYHGKNVFGNEAIA